MVFRVRDSSFIVRVCVCVTMWLPGLGVRVPGLRTRRSIAYGSTVHVVLQPFYTSEGCTIFVDAERVRAQICWACTVRFTWTKKPTFSRSYNCI